ncbi:hypothetical protein Z962_11370 [Clostridium botulinum C/D str. BKT12695]|nr:hypothetical protein Z962_11370 [Clostridium botulinum C/D str. BKT12695]
MKRQELKEKIINNLIFKNDVVKKMVTKDRSNLDYLHKKSIKDLIELRALFDNEPSTLQEANATMVCIKRTIPYLIKNYRQMKHIAKEWYKCYIDADRTGVIEDIEKCIENTNESIKYLELLQNNIKQLYWQVERLCEFYAKQNITLEYFCSVIGVNVNLAKLNIQDHKEYIEKHENYYLQLLNWGVEDAREEKEWKSNRNGMPFHDLCKEYVLVLMDSDKEIKEKIHNKFMDEFVYKGGLKTYTVEENEDGEKEIKENYPELKIIK